jgi:hypothetical protein
VAYPEIFFGGVQQIQLTEGKENSDLGAVAPYSGVPLSLVMVETHILIRFLGCIFHGIGNSARLCQNFGIISEGGLNPPNPSSGYASGQTDGRTVRNDGAYSCFSQYYKRA